MRVLLDTNVVLEVLLQRGEWLADAEAIWQASVDGRLQACIGASSLTDIYYIIRRTTGRDIARASVERCLTELMILPVDRAVLHQAPSAATTSRTPCRSPSPTATDSTLS